jgi:hypothetical protein
MASLDVVTPRVHRQNKLGRAHPASTRALGQTPGLRHRLAMAAQYNMLVARGEASPSIT